MKTVLAEMRNSVVQRRLDGRCDRESVWLYQATYPITRVLQSTSTNGIATRFDAHNRPEIRRIY